MNVGSVVFFADSTVLAYVLKKLNQEYDYGLKLILLSVDEGITGYRDDSLEVRTHPINDLYVKRWLKGNEKLEKSFTLRRWHGIR